MMASTSRGTSFHPSSSRKSLITVILSKAGFHLFGCQSTPTTSCPLSKRTSQSRVPTVPEEPVTRIFMGNATRENGQLTMDNDGNVLRHCPLFIVNYQLVFKTKEEGFKLSLCFH